ncbi:MAG TPA: acetyl-CoA C-acyltransferase [Candidatus Acidoferrales bacterium]|nr:acetyl-CoA C-acyltransferase [Candidatus Acidoferrales bacterium]
MERRWIAAGPRTPFAKSGGRLSSLDAIAISQPVVRAMLAQLEGARPDFAVWGAVMPNLTWSNVAREVLLDAGIGQNVAAFSTVMACSTSMVGALAAAAMLDDRGRSLAMAGGADSLSRVQVGLSQRASDWLRALLEAETLGAKAAVLARARPSTFGLFWPSATNRTTGKSMGEHMEMTLGEIGTIDRESQDRFALESHRRAVAAWDAGFFDDLVVPAPGLARDTIPRPDTSLEKLARLRPAFGEGGSITAGNASPLTDGAAGVWVATDAGLARLPPDLPRVELVDWEIAAVDIRQEGLLMAPAYAIPRLLERNGLTYDGIALWEIHEAFAAQVLATIALLEDPQFLRDRAGTKGTFGTVPRERVNPNGGSIAIGHPFGATGARILSQAAKELAGMAPGTYGLVSVCADGGEGTVALLRSNGGGSG